MGKVDRLCRSVGNGIRSSSDEEEEDEVLDEEVLNALGYESHSESL